MAKEGKKEEASIDPVYTPQNGGESLRQSLYVWLQAFILALGVLVLCFTFIGRVIGVDGDSMNPTLHDGDMMVLQGIGYTPRQGDVVVLTTKAYEDGRSPIVKRVVAVGGQTVDIDYATSTLYVDGVAQSEPYIKEPMRDKGPELQSHFDVPEGYICVLGDNRNNSTDSRRLGLIDERCVLGRALFVLLPFQDMGVI